MERRLATILAADVVGFSRMVEADEETAIKDLQLYSKTIRSIIVNHQGRAFGSAGDSVIAEFSSPVEAVKCASAIQNEVEHLNSGSPKTRQMQFRIGINLGDVIVDGDNLLGGGVNVAARLESLAGSGEIFISRQVYDHVHKQLPFRYENLGERQVKNLVDPVVVYRIDRVDRGHLPEAVGEAAPNRTRKNWRKNVSVAAVSLLLLIVAAAMWRMAPTYFGSTSIGSHSPKNPSIAVLSFETFNKSAEVVFLGEGIADDIITQLARNSALKVLARTSSFSMKGEGLSAEEIGRRLDVQYVLEGTVRRVGSTLRIAARLVDTKTGKNIWAKKYDSAASTIFKTQDAIVEKIVGTLLSEIRETRKTAILRRPPKNLDVYELTLRGLARKHRLSPHDIRLGLRDLRRAVKLDPHYAQAWLYLGWVEGIAIAFKWSDDLDFSDLEDAVGKVEKAIELEPTLATAYQALSILRAFQGDAQGALQAAKRSVELGPGDADNLLFLGRALASVGRFDEAVDRIRHAIALNPIRPAYYDLHFARALWGQGKFERSIKATKSCLTKAPKFVACRVFQIAGQIAVGRKTEASKAISRLLRQSPDFSVSDALKSVGFPGYAPGNKKLANQLVEAGLNATSSNGAVK